MSIKKINMHDAKTHFSEYLANLQGDDVLVICNRNIPVAEVRALPRQISEQRPVGLMQGQIKISKTFFRPLPKSLESSFYESSS